MIKQPNRTRKYKISYYTRLVISILMCLSFLVGLEVDKSVSDYEKSLVEGVDYNVKDFLVSDKEKTHNVSITLRDFFSVYNNGRVYDTYYLVDSEGNKVKVDYSKYNEVTKGDTVKVFTIDEKHYYNSLFETIMSSSSSLEFISIMSIAMPVLGLFLFVYTIIIRGSLLNPYYDKNLK